MTELTVRACSELDRPHRDKIARLESERNEWRNRAEYDADALTAIVRALNEGKAVKIIDQWGDEAIAYSRRPSPADVAP